MKLIKITSMMAVAVAAGFCMSVNATVPAGEGKNGNLELTAPATNVNVTTSAATGGSWNTRPDTDTEGAYFVIDCDAATSNQFNATRTTDKIVKCAFTLKPAPVPYTDSLPAPDNNAQVAFCIATNATDGASLQAYVSGGGWTNLTGNIPSAEYTLTITFDYTGATKYAKFAIDGVDLTNGGEAWFPIATSATGVQDYCFIGSGDLKSILTTGQDVTAEQETIGGHTIGIPEEVVTAIGGGDSSVAATVLAETSSVNGMSKLDNYVIFGLDGSGKVKEEVKPVAKPSTQVDASGNIPLNFQNLDVKAVSGTSVSYQLMGANTSAGPFTAVGSPVSDAANVKIPYDTTYKVFKVQVNVNYTPAN